MSEVSGEQARRPDFTVAGYDIPTALRGTLDQCNGFEDIADVRGIGKRDKNVDRIARRKLKEINEREALPDPRRAMKAALREKSFSSISSPLNSCSRKQRQRARLLMP